MPGDSDEKKKKEKGAGELFGGERARVGSKPVESDEWERCESEEGAIEES